MQKSARVAEHAREVGGPRDTPVGWLAREGSSCEIRSRALRHAPELSSSLVGSMSVSGCSSARANFASEFAGAAAAARCLPTRSAPPRTLVRALTRGRRAASLLASMRQAAGEADYAIT